MPTCKKYCDKSENVVGTTETVELRDDATTSGWEQITINDLLTEMQALKLKGLGQAMHLKSGDVTYKHFCPGCSNMTLIGDSALEAEYALGNPRTYSCLHLVQPKNIWKVSQDTPASLVSLSFDAIAKGRYSAFWHHRDPKIWRRTNIGNGYFPDGSQGQAVEIAINFCVDIG